MKPLRYLFLVVACVLWLGGCFKPVMHELYMAHVIPDDFRYGDMYRLANLPQFRAQKEACIHPAKPPVNATTCLYVIGDSFTEPDFLTATDLPIRTLRRFHWDRDVNKVVQLDTTCHNVLLIESVERNVRDHVGKPFRNIIVVADTIKAAGPAAEKPSWRAQLIELVRSKGIEDRLETVLFSHDFFLMFREWKATINQTFFNRVSPSVLVSADNKHIFTDLDDNPEHPLFSSFSKLSDGEVDSLVANLNHEAARYKRAGFDEVLLSIIPNKITLLEPSRGVYNHLIERIEQHPNLQVPTVDIYDTFRQLPAAPYELGDLHWNCTGRQLWLDKVANELTKSQAK